MCRFKVILTTAFAFVFVLIIGIYFFYEYEVNISVETGFVEADNGKLGIAVGNYSLDKIQNLLDVYPEHIDELYSGIMTPLGTAINARRPEVVKLLLKNGADPNFPKEYTPLSRAVDWGYAEIVKILLEYGANPVMKSDKMSPMQRAERGKDAKIIELLRNDDKEGS